MYIMLFKPEFKERVWGGQGIRDFFNKEIPYTNTGESWEISCHQNGNSIIRNGELKGKYLFDAIKLYPIEILGNKLNKNDKFPLLLKIIDAKEQLSVQVHPDDLYANKNENGELGKNEAWYILDSKEDSKLILGLKDNTTKEDFINACKENRIETVLNEIKVKKGDVINIPAGLIHAIGSGILLFEIQQNSDTTYRVYDWDRMDLDGNKRELHIEKSLEVIDFEGKHLKEKVEGIKIKSKGYAITHYIANNYFILDKINVETSFKRNKNKDIFELFMCIEGEARIDCKTNSIKVVAGDSFMIPACITEYTITGECELLRAY